MSFDRPWACPEVADLTQFPALAESRRFSCDLLRRMRDLLSGISHEHLLCVAVSGSLGRLEAGPLSDADIIVLVADPTARQSAVRAVWDRLAPLSLPPPLTHGIFSSAITPQQLLDPATRGALADDLQAFGVRIQLVLDSQPIFGANLFDELLRGIVERWSAWGVADLRDDLIRYYRALCLDARWDYGLYDGGWYVHELKRRFSRRLMYAGLLLQLGAGPGLAERLRLTPLERIADAYRRHGDSHFTRIATAYNDFLAAMNDPAVRNEWKERAAKAPADGHTESPASFQALDARGREFSRELFRFVLARQADWGEDFVAELLF